MTLDITKEDDGKHGAFIGSYEGAEAGRINFTWAGPTRLILDHTEVDPIHKGKGVGLTILEHVVDMARTDNIKIIALCPFAHAMFKKHAHLRDVL